MCWFNIISVTSLFVVTTNGWYGSNLQYYYPFYPQQSPYANYAGLHGRNNPYVSSNGQTAYAPKSYGTEAPYSSQFKFEKFEDFSNYYKHLNQKIENDVRQMYKIPQYSGNIQNLWNYYPSLYGSQSPKNYTGNNLVIGNAESLETKYNKNETMDEEIESPIVKTKQGTVTIHTTTEKTMSTEIDKPTVSENPSDYDENQIVVSINDYVEYKPKIISENGELLDVEQDDDNYDDEEQKEEIEENVTEKQTSFFRLF